MTGTILAGVMGWPIAQSRSPRLHGAWLRRYGINGAYVPMKVAPGDLERALRALPVLGFAGVNLTVPHKEAAVAIVDRLDATALRTGSVNMVTVAADGMLEGASTDGFGFMENLKALVPGRPVDGGPVTVLGAGGSARAIVDALIASGERCVRIVNRDGGRAERLALGFGAAAEAWPWALRHVAVASAALVVNTTTQGMEGEKPLDLSLALLSDRAIVADIVYTPLETPLLAGARARGVPVVDGLGMLLHQARPAFARWFGVEPVVDDALRARMLEPEP